jgi:AcrR family transcriptional regulator
MTKSTRPRSPRADARRNYERLLSTARAAFAEHGADASLNDIAQRAGVGPGTLYRHFPTREALLAALLQEGFEALNTTARELLGSTSPDEALLTWLHAFIAHVTTYRGLSASVIGVLRDETSDLYNACHEMRTSGAELLDRAKRAGKVRATVNDDDMLALANAIAWVSERLPDDDQRINRMLAMLHEGLRPRDTGS